MKLVIYCEECTVIERMTHKWAVASFESLTEAVFHINQYNHIVKIELEEADEGEE